MPPGISYAHENLFKAMHALALGIGDIRARLEIAYESFYILQPKDFPPELRADWGWVQKQMTRCGPVFKCNGEVRVNSVHHTMRRIHNKTGVKIAEKIFELFWELDRQVGEKPLNDRQ